MNDKITLRAVEQSDLDAFYSHQQDAEAVWMAAFTAKDPADRAAFDVHWAKILTSPDVITRTILYDGQIAGHIAKFVMFDKPQMTYWTAREFWGRGVATRALELFLQEYVERPVYASAAFDNVGSMRVLEKCGFERVGSEKFFANARGCEIEEVIFRLDG